MVRANGDHTLGHYEAGHLHGVVREEEEGGLVTRELSYIRGQRHRAWREWRAGELTCVGVDTGATWTRTRSDNKILTWPLFWSYLLIAEADHSLSGMLSLRPMVNTNMMVRSSSCILT